MDGINGMPEQSRKKQTPTPREFVLKYLRYLPWVAISLVIAVVIAKIKLRYAIPIYKTESRMLIKRENAASRSTDKFDDIFAGNSFQNIFNEMELLKSRPLAFRVVKLLGLQNVCYNKGKIRSSLLYKDAPIQLELMPGIDSIAGLTVQVTILDQDHYKINDEQKSHLFGEVIISTKPHFKIVKRFPEVYNLYSSNTYLLSVNSISAATEDLVSNLKVTLVDNFAQVINLSYESENPFMAMDILNTLMEVYKESNIEDKRQMRISTLQFIDERLDTLKHELGIVEGELTEYIETNKAFELSKQSGLFLEKLDSETSGLVQQELKLSVINWLIEYLSSPGNAYRAVPVELGTQEGALVPLITEYNQLQQERQNALATMPATNPYIQNNLDVRIPKLRHDIIEALKNVRQSYVMAKSSLQKQNVETETKLQSIPRKGQQKAEKERQQKIKEELYLFLLQKKEETAIASASTISDSKIVEPARYNAGPISPNPRSIYLTAIVLGLVIPVGFFVAKEYLNDKIQGKADIEKMTDTPFIGEVGHAEAGATLVVVNQSRKFIAEQFRIIRTNLQFFINKIETPVILVTSSFSGEGKSFISTNMGGVIALTGKKTVILELDIRKPKVIANLELKRQAGITNFIVGRAKIEEIILSVPDVPNLFVIPCGPVPPNPGEILLDPKLAELFDYVKAHFDVVIVDTAPVGLVSDALIIGKYADATLYIMRQNYTYKKQLGLINELYENQKLFRPAILLNDVKISFGYGSYYGYGTGYGYGYGYGSGYFEDDGSKRKKAVWRRIVDYFRI